MGNVTKPYQRAGVTDMNSTTFSMGWEDVTKPYQRAGVTDSLTGKVKVSGHSCHKALSTGRCDGQYPPEAAPCLPLRGGKVNLLQNRPENTFVMPRKNIPVTFQCTAPG